MGKTSYQKEYRKNMTDEQKQKYKEARKHKYHNMTNEQKRLSKKYRENMTDEQKQKCKESEK